MASGGDNYSKYKERRRLTGRLSIEPQSHDDALHLLAEGEGLEDIVEMMEGKITQEELDKLLASTLGKRRLEYLAKAEARKGYSPQSPDEVTKYVKERLVKISKHSDDKQKIEALKALHKVAMDERENKPAIPKAAEDDEGLKELKAAFGGQK